MDINGKPWEPVIIDKWDLAEGAWKKILRKIEKRTTKEDDYVRTNCVRIIDIRYNTLDCQLNRTFHKLRLPEVSLLRQHTPGTFVRAIIKINCEERKIKPNFIYISDTIKIPNQPEFVFDPSLLVITKDEVKKFNRSDIKSVNEFPSTCNDCDGYLNSDQLRPCIDGKLFCKKCWAKKPDEVTTFINRRNKDIYTFEKAEALEEYYFIGDFFKVVNGTIIKLRVNTAKNYVMAANLKCPVHIGVAYIEFFKGGISFP